MTSVKMAIKVRKVAKSKHRRFVCQYGKGCQSNPDCAKYCNFSNESSGSLKLAQSYVKVAQFECLFVLTGYYEILFTYKGDKIPCVTCDAWYFVLLVCSPHPNTDSNKAKAISAELLE